MRGGLACLGNNILDTVTQNAYNDWMPFASVPSESGNQINKAGEILSDRKKRASVSEFEWAWDLTGRWRACHAYPINTFQSTLRTKTRDFSGAPIVAQRLKRMPTIIDKLRRYPSMQLTQMQDIAGVRAVLDSVSQVRELANDYRNNTAFDHRLRNVKDYISEPRDMDGYRSIHLIYEYKNNRNHAYDGLILEVQMRSKLQHIWATAVETMGTFLGQALKSRQGEKAWLDFFAIRSSAFALMEHCPSVPRFEDLSLKQTFQAVKASETALGALERMRGFSAAVNEIVKTGTARFYHVVVLDSLQKTVEIYPYDRDSFKEALSAVSKFEEKAAKGEKIEPVLVSAGPLDQLRRAYPNFFLDIRAFDQMVKTILNKAA